MPNPTNLRFVASAEAATIYLEGPIGIPDDPESLEALLFSPNPPATAPWVRAQLDSIAPGLPVRVVINSPGGDVTDGLGIYNALKTCGREVTTEVVGIAASMASVIFCAGTKRRMTAGARLMVHNPAVLATSGGSADLRAKADLLDKVAGDLAGIYASACGKPTEEVLTWMNATTWMNADEAVALGLATDADLPDARAASGDFKMVALFTPAKDGEGDAGNPQTDPGDTELARVTAELEKANADLADARAELEKANARADLADKDAAQLRSDKDALTGELAAFRKEKADAEAARAKAEASKFVAKLVAEGVVSADSEETLVGSYLTDKDALVKMFALIKRPPAAGQQPLVDRDPAVVDRDELATIVRTAKDPLERARAHAALMAKK